MLKAQDTALVRDFLASGGFTVDTAERPVKNASKELLRESLDSVRRTLAADARAKRRSRMARLVRLRQLIEGELQARENASASRPEAS